MQQTIESKRKQLFHWSKGDVGRKHANPRFGHSVTFVDDILFMFGGYSSEYISTLSYLHEGKMWKDIPCSGIVPRGRCGHCAFSYMKKLFIWSGDSGDDCLDDLWCFDTKTMCWQRIITENNPTSRAWASSCVVGDWLIMAGGENRYQQGVQKGSYNVFWDQWALHLPTYRWYRMFDKDIITPCPRVGHSMASVGNMVVTFGGAIPAEWYKTAKHSGKDNSKVSGLVTGDRAGNENAVMVIKTAMSKENMVIENTNSQAYLVAPGLLGSPSSTFMESPEATLGRTGSAAQGKYLTNDVWYFFVDEKAMSPTPDCLDGEIHPPVARWIRGNFKAQMEIHQKPDEIKQAPVIPAPRAFQVIGIGAVSKTSSNDKTKSTITPLYIYGGISVDGPVSDIWRLDVITREELESCKYDFNSSTQKNESKHRSPYSASFSVVSACFPGFSPTAHEDTINNCIVSACVPNTVTSGTLLKTQTKSPNSRGATSSKSSTRPNSRNPITPTTGAKSPSERRNKAVEKDNLEIYNGEEISHEVDESESLSSDVDEAKLGAQRLVSGKPPITTTGRSHIVSPRAPTSASARDKPARLIIDDDNKIGNFVCLDTLAPRGRHSMAGTIIPARFKRSKVVTGLSLYFQANEQTSKTTSPISGKKDKVHGNGSIFERTKERDILVVNGGVGEVDKMTIQSLSNETSQGQNSSLLGDTWFIKMPEDSKFAHLQNTVDDDVAAVVKRNTIVAGLLSKATEGLIELRDEIAEDKSSPHKQLEEAVGRDNPNEEFDKDSLLGMVVVIQDKLRQVEEFTANSQIEAIKTINSLKRSLAIIAADGRKMGIKAKDLSRTIADEYSLFKDKINRIMERVDKRYNMGKKRADEYFLKNKMQVERIAELQAKIESALSEFEDSVNNTFKSFDKKMLECTEKFNICSNFIDNFDQHQGNMMNIFFCKVTQFQNAIEEIHHSLEKHFKAEESKVNKELQRITDELAEQKLNIVNENTEDHNSAVHARQEFREKLENVDQQIKKFDDFAKKQTAEYDEKFRKMIDELHKSIFDDHKKQKENFNNLIEEVHSIIENKNKEADEAVVEINTLIDGTVKKAKKACKVAELHYRDESEKIKLDFKKKLAEIDTKLNEFKEKINEYKAGINRVIDSALGTNETDIRAYVDNKVSKKSAATKEELHNRLASMGPKILSSLSEINTLVDGNKALVEKINKDTVETKSIFKSEHMRVEAKTNTVKRQLADVKDSTETTAERVKERTEVIGEYNNKYEKVLDSYSGKCKDGKKTVIPEFERRVARDLSLYKAAEEQTVAEFEGSNNKLNEINTKLSQLKVPKISTQSGVYVAQVEELLAGYSAETAAVKKELNTGIDSLGPSLAEINSVKAKFMNNIKIFEAANTPKINEAVVNVKDTENLVKEVASKYAPVIEQEKRIAEQEQEYKTSAKLHNETRKSIKGDVKDIKTEYENVLSERYDVVNSILEEVKENTQKALVDHRNETKAKCAELEEKAQHIDELTEKYEKSEKATDRFVKDFDKESVKQITGSLENFKEDVANYEADVNDAMTDIKAFVAKKLEKSRKLIENAENVSATAVQEHRGGWIEEIKEYLEKGKDEISTNISRVDNSIKENIRSLNIADLVAIQNYGFNNIELSLRTVDSQISDINVRLHTFQDDLRRAKKATEPTSAVSSRAFVSCDNLMKTLYEDTETARLIKLKSTGADISSVSARNSLRQVRSPSPGSKTPTSTTPRTPATPPQVTK